MPMIYGSGSTPALVDLQGQAEPNLQVWTPSFPIQAVRLKKKRGEGGSYVELDPQRPASRPAW